MHTEDCSYTQILRTVEHAYNPECFCDLCYEIPASCDCNTVEQNTLEHDWAEYVLPRLVPQAV